MLQAHNALRAVLLTENAPLTDRLKRLYSQFRIRTAPDGTGGSCCQCYATTCERHASSRQA